MNVEGTPFYVQEGKDTQCVSQLMRYYTLKNKHYKNMENQNHPYSTGKCMLYVCSLKLLFNVRNEITIFSGNVCHLKRMYLIMVFLGCRNKTLYPSLDTLYHIAFVL